MPRRAPLAPKSTRFEIIRRLGSGGTSNVYLARDLLWDGKEVALKVCRSTLEPRDVLREFRILRELRHPGIARAHDFGRLHAGGPLFLTLEYVPGTDLDRVSKELRSQGAGGQRRLLDIMAQVTATLELVHASGLVHLDVKPANIVVTHDSIKLIDFGLAENRDGNEPRPTCGTALFMAPEVLQGGPIDARADLYSLGVTFYRALTGRYPVNGKSLEEIIKGHVATLPEPPRGLDDQLASILLRLLAKSPRHRFQSGKELLAALRALLPRGSSLQLPRLEEPAFVDRRQELDQFFGWWNRLRQSSSTPHLRVLGAPGSGKTRFVDTIVGEALATGALVVRQPSTPRSGDDGLRRLVEKAKALRSLARRDLSAYQLLLAFVGLDESTAALHDIKTLDARDVEARVFRQAHSLLRQALRPGALLVLDDFDLADARLKAFLQYFWREESQAPAGMAIGCITTERTAKRATPAGEGKAGETQPYEVQVTLKDLARRDAESLLASLAPQLDGVEKMRILREARGNVALLVAHVRSVLDAASEHKVGGLIFPVVPPTGLKVKAALRDLDAPERALLTHLAIANKPLDSHTLARRTRLGGKSLQGARERMAGAGWIRGDDRGWYLDPGVDVELVVSALSKEECKHAHVQAGLDSLRAGTTDASTARHLLLGGKLGGKLNEGVRVATEAARNLRRRGRLQEALDLVGMAMELGGESARSVALLEEQGDLQEKTGDFNGSAGSYAAALGHRSLTRQTKLRLSRKLGGIDLRRGRGETALKTFQEALELVDDSSDVSENLHLLREISALHLFRGEEDRAIAFGHRGLEILSSPAAHGLAGEDRAQHALSFHLALGHVFLRQFELDRAATEFRRGLEEAKEVGSPASTALLLNHLGIAYSQDNRLQEALKTYEKAFKLAKSLGDETAIFSILCNLATLRARRGEIAAADALLREAAERPQSRSSQRAKLFLLHTQGLVHRVAARDSSEVWNDAVRLAEALPDPLFASYGRLCLFENEILAGRWASARCVLKELEAARGKDRRLDRSVDARHAYLAALVGKKAEAQELLRAYVDTAGGRPYVDLWDALYWSAAKLELGQWQESALALTQLAQAFDQSAQAPSALECRLLLAEVQLRMRDATAARRELRAAEELLARHDTQAGARNATARLAFLASRAELLAPMGEALPPSSRLAAARESSIYPGAELSWLTRFVQATLDPLAAGAQLSRAREEFLAGLNPSDRATYAGRDHVARLGLSTLHGAQKDRAPGAAAMDKRYECLVHLAHQTNLADGLQAIVKAVGGTKGAVMIDGVPRAVVGFTARALSSLNNPKNEAKAASQALRDVVRVPLRGLGGGAVGHLLVETGRKEAGEATLAFLEAAARLLATAGSETAVDHKTWDTTRTIRLTRSRGPLGSMPPLDKIKSAPMRSLLELVLRTRDSELPILISGESGTGKDHLARWIHSVSPRAKGPFVTQDCATLPEALVEADIFGYEAGAFTGAEAAKTGHVFSAQGGTYYLDRIEGLSLEVQAKLLRLLEDKAVRPLGGHSQRPADVRVIASSQSDLRELVARGEFRRDLYFRLAGITLQVPPLRERAEDIPLLVTRLLGQLPGRKLELRPEAMAALKAHSWPGNVRELEGVVRRLALTSEGSIDAKRVEEVLDRPSRQQNFPRWIFHGKGFEEAVDDLKREYLLDLLDRCDGDLDLAATELKTSRRNLYFRLSNAGIRPGGPKK